MPSNLQIIGVRSPKADKTSDLSKTLQVFAKSIAEERLTTSEGFLRPDDTSVELSFTRRQRREERRRREVERVLL